MSDLLLWAKKYPCGWESAGVGLIRVYSGLFGMDEAFVDEFVLDQRDYVEVLLKFGK